MPRVYTYTRSATEEPNAQPKHAASLQAWLAKYPDHSLAGAFEDRGVSGLTPPAERPGFKALLTALQTEPVEVVLVPSLEHVTRDRGALPEILAHLPWQRVRLLTVESLPNESIGEQLLAQSVLAAIQTYSRQRRSRRARV